MYLSGKLREAKPLTQRAAHLPFLLETAESRSSVCTDLPQQWGGFASRPGTTQFVIQLSDLFQPDNQKVVSRRCLIFRSRTGPTSIHCRKHADTFSRRWRVLAFASFSSGLLEIVVLIYSNSTYLALDDDMNCKIFPCILKLHLWRFCFEFAS